MVLKNHNKQITFEILLLASSEMVSFFQLHNEQLLLKNHSHVCSKNQLLFEDGER